MKPDFAPLFKLPRAIRMQLVTDLWDSIALEDDDDPVPPHVIAELRRRSKKYKKNPESAMTWEEVKKYVRTGKR